MELGKYINKVVKVDLKNGYYYEGKIISCDKDSICIVDKFGKTIDISESIISFIREVVEWDTAIDMPVFILGIFVRNVGMGILLIWEREGNVLVMLNGNFVKIGGGYDNGSENDLPKMF